MPNHVHALVEQFGGQRLDKIAQSWKSYTATEINRALGRSGPLWQREYFDRFMRDGEQLAATIAYIEANPVAAKLVGTPEEWRWSSAHWRNADIIRGR